MRAAASCVYLLTFAYTHYANEQKAHGGRVDRCGQVANKIQ